MCFPTIAPSARPTTCAVFFATSCYRRALAFQLSLAPRGTPASTVLGRTVVEAEEKTSVSDRVTFQGKECVSRTAVVVVLPARCTPCSVVRWMHPLPPTPVTVPRAVIGTSFPQLVTLYSATFVLFACPSRASIPSTKQPLQNCRLLWA